MAQSSDTLGMLDLMIRPGFCVKDNLIVKVNPAAESRQIKPGTSIGKLLATGKKEYGTFAGGCLYLTLDLYGQLCGASVTRIEDFDVFLLDEDTEQEELQTLALAARELRDPLTSIMATTDVMFPSEALQSDPLLREHLARLNRGLYQMLRVIGNMSDAGRFSSGSAVCMETVDITALMAELFQKVTSLAMQAGITLEFTNLKRPLCMLADRDMLERAVLNILSNSLKFTPKGGTVSVALSRKAGMVILTVQDNGEGIADNIMGSVFSRFLRKPAVEDRRYGLGLGLLLVRSTAAQHGGTVLLDQPQENGVRITMTLAIHQNPDSTVRSPRLRIDYAGEWDHGLVELAEILPPELYEIK